MKNPYIVVGLACFAIACGDDEPASRLPCDAPSFSSALAAAGAGTEVTLGACEIAGVFEVPAGVTVVGQGVGVTELRGDGTAPVLDLAPGAGVRSVSIHVSGSFGIRARGVGAFDVRDVAIDVERGIAIGVRDASVFALSSARITGPITSANARDIGSPGAPSETGTYGVLAYDVMGLGASEGLRLSDVEVRGFATAGVAIVRSTLHWAPGEGPLEDVIEGNRGHGLMVFGGRASLTDVRACGTLSAPGLPGLTLTAAEGAVLETTRTTVCDGDGFGVFHDAATGSHTGLEVRGLGQAAVWAQARATLTVGEGSVLEGSGVAGVAAIDVENVAITGTRISEIHEGPIPNGGAGAERMGDGVHVARTALSAPPVSVSLDDVELVGNERIGALLDAFEERATLSLRAVSVSGTGTQLGAVAQRVVELPVDWDADVAREGATLANDEAFAELRRVLEVSGIIMPPAAPPTLE